MRLTDTCYVSFNANPCKDIDIFRSDMLGAETALCIDGQYFVLNGDYRDEFTTAANQNITTCVDVYERNKVHRSTWSMDASVRQ